MMVSKKWVARGALVVLGIAVVSCTGSGERNTNAQPPSMGGLDQSFVAASQHYQVPADLLRAISYMETRWHQMPGVVTLDQGYGVMHLREVGGPLPTLQRAHLLTGIDETALKSDADSNIRGGAAVLQQLFQETSGTPHPGDGGWQRLESWFDAVSRYGGGDAETETGRRYAQAVFEVLMSGATGMDPETSGVTLASHQLLLPAHDLIAESQAFATPDYAAARWIPASSNNYTSANRPYDQGIHYIIIHDTEGSYTSAINWFQNPAASVSAHYVVRSSDGQITQMVQDRDIAWHTGCWWMNQHAVGVEHEGFMSRQGWYTDIMYRSSAALSRYLVNKYGIPIDRRHIIGHSELYDIQDYDGQYHCSWVPSGERHWDPGPNWNWPVYIDYIRGSSGGNGSSGGSGAGGCPNGDGFYCGGNGVGGDTNDLYRCTGGQLALDRSCGNGCERMPPGTADRCRPLPAPSACPDGNGFYCGGDGVAGDSADLYQCNNGRLSLVLVCSGGCERMPAGIPDRCRLNSCPGGDGLYCGGNGVTGNANTLYRCAGGALREVSSCGNGCERMPNGVPDRCRPAPTPPPCPDGDGLYCGGDGVGGKPTVLYECRGGILAELKACPGGCQQMPAGVADRCAASCPNGEGLYCGGDGVSGASNTLYNCRAGDLTVVRVCAGGCQRMPSNVPDQCAPETTSCPDGDGLYCGENGVGGDSNTLYSCRAGDLTIAEKCSAGCQRMPTGVPDRCAAASTGGGSTGGGSGGSTGGSGGGTGGSKPAAKGLWIWYFDYTGLSASQVATTAKNDGVGFVLIKSGQDGSFWSSRYNASIVSEFTSRGIRVYAWPYITPGGVSGGAIQAAIQAAQVPGTSGVVLDVEVEFEGSYASQAQQLCQGIHAGAPNTFLGYTSFGWVGYHGGLPFSTFDRYCNGGFFPQIYWADRGVSWTFGYTQAMEMILQAGLHAPVWPVESNDIGFPSTIDLNGFLDTTAPYGSVWEFPGTGWPNYSAQVSQLASLHWRNP